MGMRADGAELGRVFADDDMSAVGALPNRVAVLGKYQPVFHVGKQLFIPFLVFLLDRRNCVEQPRHFGEALFPRDFRKSRR